MSALTKVFIVLLVVLSLLLASGVVVFVNRAENFKATIAKNSQAVTQAQTATRTATAEAANWRAATDKARAERDAAYADEQKQLAARDAQISTLNSQIASGDSNMKINAVTADNLTAALNASEAVRTKQAETLTTTRADYDKSVTQVSGLNSAISDLTNRLEVATRKMNDFQEQLQEARATVDRDNKIIADAGIQTTGKTEVGLAGGAPPINGVIVSTNSQNGIPLATISVGSNDQVKTGMKFNVIDRDKGEFLGELTVETVDQQSATGKLEGPKVSTIKAGNEAKTQLY